jgi:hypothetical protein
MQLAWSALMLAPKKQMPATSAGITIRSKLCLSNWFALDAG